MKHGNGNLSGLQGRNVPGVIVSTPAFTSTPRAKRSLFQHAEPEASQQETMARHSEPALRKVMVNRVEGQDITIPQPMHERSIMSNASGEKDFGGAPSPGESLQLLRSSMSDDSLISSDDESENRDSFDPGNKDYAVQYSFKNVFSFSDARLTIRSLPSLAKGESLYPWPCTSRKPRTNRVGR
jgi:hypothetical protein